MKWMVRLLLLAALAWLDPAIAQGQTVKGSVLEVWDVDIYTYLRLKTTDGEIWAAVAKARVKKGAEVTIVNAMTMTDFESKTLKKTFDKIIFGALAGADGAAPGIDLNQMHHGAAKAPGAAEVKVPKAQGPNAKTVEEIVGKRAELKDKPVMVRGKVVKFTPDVMGKNWVHLRDGSGSARDSTNDILVTTKDRTQVGNVVVAEGVVRIDVNLGSGYAYEVLIEEATLRK